MDHEQQYVPDKLQGLMSSCLTQCQNFVHDSSITKKACTSINMTTSCVLSFRVLQPGGIFLEVSTCSFVMQSDRAQLQRVLLCLPMRHTLPDRLSSLV
jgi:hypothetical protein